ncbi:MAG: hypothetical protein HYX42_04135 [Polaromonas sp.]|uniref:hypothetical protein n=1 Tax=Polaromonas sp. TaxID=1869339 RepID=UPI0025D7DBF6|nr:hypothetical protein [Polaromonas sp.]MBI2725419.1 hypothetical protein [Polaromonas sp.]
MKRDDMTLDLPMTAHVQAIDPQLVIRQPSMTKALQLCQTLSGKDDAQFYGNGGIVKDQAQWSRIMGPSNHNFPHEKLNLFMDLAGNEAPLMWLLQSRGYDLNSLRLLETETEKKLRLAQEENAALRRVLTGAKA